MRLDSKMIGINNRDLDTFETSLDTTRSLAKLVPIDRMIVCESGLQAATTSPGSPATACAPS